MYLSSKNFKNGTINLTNVEYISEETYSKHFRSDSGALTQPVKGDILFSIIGSIGSPYIVRIGEKYGVSSSVSILRPDEEMISSMFLFYWMRGQTFQNAINGIKGGVAQNYVSLEMIKSLPVCIPPLSQQKMIASVLSAYDDLIENNEKRIKALEEMAQLLYTEWFVKFKFPISLCHSREGGNPVRKMVDSGTGYGKIPGGWRIVEMRSIAKIVDCLHTKKPEEIKTGNKILLRLNNILDEGMINLADKYLISDSDYKKWTSNIELHDGDCVVTNVGRIAASAQIANGLVAAAGRNMTVIRPEKIPASFLIQYLHSGHMKKKVSKKIDAGVIMGSLNVKNIYLLKVLLPEGSVLELFSKLASGIRVEMNKLHQQNYVLSQTRDLLIPQLVTGRRELKN